jgi:hypothetical protein
LFAPDSGTASSATGIFNYVTNVGNLLFGLISQYVGATADATNPQVFVADLVTTNATRTSLKNVIYLNLLTADSRLVADKFIDPVIFGEIPAAGAAQRTLSAANGGPRQLVSGITSPSVPRSELVATPTETDLALAVREQLQALGIYARSLTLEEKLAREQKLAVFVSVPTRVRPADSDYLVAEGRVEDRAVRDVIKNAADTGLIGAGQSKLEAVAGALASSYEAYQKAATPGEKTPEVMVAEYRDWLVANSNVTEAKLVLDYMKALRTTLKKIELLGLTTQEFEGSKAQIYGSVLRARLNIEPEFLRLLVEGLPSENLWEVKKPAATPPHQQAAISPVESKTGRAMY